MNRHEQAAVYPRMDNKIVSALITGAWKVKILESPDYSEIKEIRIFH